MNKEEFYKYCCNHPAFEHNIYIKEAENAQFDISYVPGKALEERIGKTVERVTPVMQNMGLINN